MDDPEAEFLVGMLQLHYGRRVSSKLKRIARRVSWARGWPEDPEAFWNAEAFWWKRQIDAEVRALIERRLAYLRGGKNLDLGCGAYSYLPSIGFDISPVMLRHNDLCSQKIVGDVEQQLPFLDGEFGSVTAIFLLNYIHHYALLLQEIRRVLRSKGVFVAVLAEKVQTWPRQKQINSFSPLQWKKIMRKAGFLVRMERKGQLWFLHSRKVIKGANYFS